MHGIILLEGADCTGKTTLANAISEKYKDKCLYIHNTWYKGMDVRDEHWKSLNKAFEAYDDGLLVIIDRHWISEQIYSTIYRNGPEYNEDIDEMLYGLRKRNALTIICSPPVIYTINKHRELKNIRDEMYNDISDVVCYYHDLWYGSMFTKGSGIVDNLIKLGGVNYMSNYMLYDVTQDGKNIKKYIKKIINRLKEISNDRS